jgi:hypothetical protein
LGDIVHKFTAKFDYDNLQTLLTRLLSIIL